MLISISRNSSYKNELQQFGLAFVGFGSSLVDIYLVLPGVELLTSNDLDIISARDEYLRAYPPAAQQLCMIYAPRHMFLWIK